MPNNSKSRIRHYEAAIESYEQMIAAYRETIEHLQKEDTGKAGLSSFHARKHRQEADREIALAEHVDAGPRPMMSRCY
ncbi:MAG: hypothetical protein EBU79_09350 [Betaproteobacteria bacterium]|nr:hypothetical protein [Betaproteobacteria bacterium]